MKRFIQHLTLEGDFRISKEIDPLPHYIGEPIEINIKKALNNFVSVDIGNYAEEKDENFIYEEISYGRFHDLHSEMVGNRTGIGSNRITAYKKGYLELDDDEQIMLAKYLVEYRFSMEDFMNFKPKKTIAYKREILADEHFYWFLGQRMFRGLIVKGLVNFFYFPDEDNLLEKMRATLKHLELEFMEYNEAKGNKRRIIIKCIAFGKYMAKIFERSKSKWFLPGDYLPTQDKKIQAFIDGLVESRRLRPKDNRKQEIFTTSPKLFEQVRILLAYLGYVVKIKKIPYHDLNGPTTYKINWLNAKVHPKSEQFLMIREQKTEEIIEE